MGTKPIPRSSMHPSGGYLDPQKPKVKGTCYNFGDSRHFSPNCPWPKAPKIVPILCGNCGGERHISFECPHLAAPKMIVKYVKEPQSNIVDARLL
jgi:hypothetical protein